MLRLSSYTILSSRMKSGGYCILSGLTGAVDVIDEELYGYVSNKLQEADPHSIIFEEDELSDELREQWLERGYLVEYPHEDERELARVVSESMHENAQKKHGIILVPDMDCNYRCVYCFEQGLQASEGFGKARRTAMTDEEVDQVFACIDAMGTGQDGINNITLYGGEPLNAKNKDLLYRIVHMGTERGISFGAITNAHDLDVYLPIIGTGKISSLQITVDGPKDIHDKRRIAMDGTSSYDAIFANIRRVLAETDATISLRINIDDGNVDGFEELLEAFHQEGWLENTQFSVYTSIVTSPNPEKLVGNVIEAEQAEGKLRDVARKYKRVSVGGSASVGAGSMLQSLVDNQPFGLKSAYCGAAIGMLIFLTGGIVQSCWETIGQDISVIGSYSAAGLALDPDKSAAWFERSTAKIPECLDCSYCLLCGGGCPQHALHQHGTLYKPFCQSFDKVNYPWILADAVERFLNILQL